MYVCVVICLDLSHHATKDVEKEDGEDDALSDHQGSSKKTKVVTPESAQTAAAVRPS